jgi:hypothetical protein
MVVLPIFAIYAFFAVESSFAAGLTAAGYRRSG